MSNLRSKSFQTAINRERIEVRRPNDDISDYFAKNVFHSETMRKYLTKDIYKKVLTSIKDGTKLDRAIADYVAAGMKAWALDRGATHHTHWFQPLTGNTAEKHDSFFSPIDDSRGIESFSGDELVQGEPDGSSFPSGGLRDTHEARGYTAWDPSSPAFIMEIGKYGKTLCIPTIFISYTGAAMDYKAPLLKSNQFLEKSALSVCKMFDRNVTRVNATLGWEQEYFLIDEAFYYARPDLMMAGRTLVGHYSPKGQQLDDHYFGSIPERVYSFMLDLETEALKLGIPVSTRHNEVAPGQYEFAPIFSSLNKAVDQNQLFMDLLDRVSKRHKLRCLMHEKPFAGLNGSGKHNNWSLATDTGINLLQPGKTPKNNIQFLAFFLCTIKAVNDYADLIRASIASASNDHRLGANEAPPAIISVFIGSALTKVLEFIELEVKHGGLDEYEKSDLKTDIHNLIPDLLLDNTDRNRTSPFAFTGNKFEVRAVGSSANCAMILTTLNTIVADVLVQFKKDVDDVIKGGEKKDGAILRIIRRYIEVSKPILFEGDNYSDSWKEEAKTRGLSNVLTTPAALDFFLDKKSQDVFTKNNILSLEELHARYDVWNEIYHMRIQIEARVLCDIAKNQILPAALTYQTEILENIEKQKNIGISVEDFSVQLDLVSEINGRIKHINSNCIALIEARKKANKIENAPEKAKSYEQTVKPFFDSIRYDCDRLERIIRDDIWPLPKYIEMLFVR